MSARSVRHCVESILSRRRAPENELERTLFVLVFGSETLTKELPLKPWTTSSVLDPSVKYPYEVFKNPKLRAVMEAFLLSSQDDTDVAEALAMPVDEVSVYRTLFFDTSTLKTHLEKITFIEGLPEDMELKSLYKIGYHQGLGALRWHFCPEKGMVEPEVVIKTIMTDSFFRALEHRGQPLTSKVAKEAAKLALTAIACAKSLLAGEHVTDTVTQREELLLKFHEARHNTTIEDLAKEGLEVLH